MFEKLDQESVCTVLQLNALNNTRYFYNGRRRCPAHFDGILCWPPTLEGFTQYLTCPAFVGNIQYDTSDNASKDCLLGGTWSNWSDYLNCKPVHELNSSLGDTLQALAQEYRIAQLIYYVGYTLSITSLVLAILIFFCARKLSCMRNKIHVNLFISYFFSDVLWIINNQTLVGIAKRDSIFCRSMVTIFNYCQCTNFFWMLVEGLYLFILTVFTFSASRVEFFFFVLIGWGIPIVVIAIWGIVKHHFDKNRCWMDSDGYVYDYIFMVPILVVLLINCVFLCSIMYVLLSRSRTKIRELDDKQYRKGARKLLLLLPLLGLTHVLVLVEPENGGMWRLVISIINALLVSTQGFWITLFFCFTNHEVKSLLKPYFLQRTGSLLSTRTSSSYLASLRSSITRRRGTSAARASDSPNVCAAVHTAGQQPDYIPMTFVNCNQGAQRPGATE